MKRRKNLFIPSSRIFVGQENVPLFVIASAFMARGNPFSLVTDRRVASLLAMTPLFTDI
ncbi:MAG: hypothetical protein IJT41_04130 [Clostridia bacterium]|nr:hypothetical protein [Clostridia bacterium]